MPLQQTLQVRVADSAYAMVEMELLAHEMSKTWQAHMLTPFPFGTLSPSPGI